MPQRSEDRSAAGGDNDAAALPLAGLTILEIGDGVAVAVCGRLLADLGAALIKVEDPSGDDPVRRLDGNGEPPPDSRESSLHLLLNANKASVVLDLRTAAGLAGLGRLADGADAFIGFFGAGLRAAGGPRAADLRGAHPTLPVLAFSWYGLTGPWREFAGNDYLAQHVSGLAFSTARRVEDLAAQPPLAAPGYLAEMTAGLTGAIALLCGLFEREQSGRGDLIDVSVVESLVTFLNTDVVRYTYGAGMFSRTKDGLGIVAPIGEQAAADGLATVVIRKEPQWRALLDILGKPAWGDDERFATMRQRIVHWDALRPLLAEAIRRFPRAYIVEEGQRRGVGVAPFNTIAEAVDSEQITERGFIVEDSHPRLGRLRSPGPMFRMTDDSTPPRPAPGLGEHTEVVLDRRPASPSDHGRTSRSSTPERPALPLRGIRVADFSWIIAGPYATYLLARMGAEVIKIEGLAPVDHTRENGPFLGDARGLNTSGHFNVLHGGKASVSLQLSDPAQARLARELALSCDIVIENFGYGTMARFGLGYETLAAAKPDLVMVSCSGFGLTGPMKAHKAFVSTVAAYVGLTAATGFEGGHGMPVGGAYSDHASGLAMALAVLAGLRQARRQGRGRHFDLSMAEATLSLMGPLVMDYLVRGAVPQRRGNAVPGYAPCGVYPCRGEDKWLALAVASEAEWQALVGAMGAPAWAADARFADLAGRRAHRAELDRLIGAWTREQENLALAERLQRAGVAAAPSSDPEDLARNPQLLGRGTLAPQPHPLIEARLAPNVPWHFANYPSLDTSVPPPPLLGADNARVLATLPSATPELIARICQAAAAVVEQRDLAHA